MHGLLRPAPPSLGALVLGLALTACGGGSNAVSLKDARPCLDRLALVVVSKPPPGVTLADDVPDSAQLAFENATAGANAATLIFYESRKRVEKALADQRAFLKQSGGSVTIRRSRRLTDTVLVSWSSPPTKRQVARVRACVS